MKFTRTGNTEVGGDDFKGYDAGVTTKNLGKMFSVTSKNMYRRPIQSIVREITSNCFDSHIEAKVDDPVIIKINHDEGGDYILFKDVGVGISEERMEKVYANWFESTKEDVEDQIGMWGLGSKSPLAYTNAFYLTTWYNGKVYEYTVREGVDKPRIDLLIEDDTEERNGSEVKIYIKTSSDLSAFFNACKSELLYFDNVYLDTYLTGFNNEYSILEYNTFKFRPDAQYSNQLHLIIGKVPYPINWDDIGRPPILIPCGLQFKIGDLQVTPERESIRYADFEIPDGNGGKKIVFPKDIINKKIDEFLAELKLLYENQVSTEFEDYEEYKRYKFSPSISLMLDTYKIDVTRILTKRDPVFVPLKEFRGVIPENLFFKYRASKLYIKGKKMRECSQTVDNKTLIENFCITMPKSKELTSKKVAYLFDYAYDLTGKAAFFVIEEDYMKWSVQRKYFQLEYYRDYHNTNLLKQYKLITEFIRDEFKRLAFKYEDVNITPEWIAKQKEARTNYVSKKDNSFLVYNYGNVTISDNKEYVILDDFKKYTGFIIYGFDEDEELLKNFRILLSNSKYGLSNFRDKHINPKVCKLYKTAKRNEKHFLELTNAFYIYDFMGEHKVFKRFATAALIEEEGTALKINGYAGHANDYCRNFRELMGWIFPPVADTMKDLNEACNDYGKLAYSNGDTGVTHKFVEDIITVAKQYNLYDKELYEVHQKLERYVKGLDLLNFTVLNQKSLEYVVDFLILMGKKVSDVWLNLEQYEKDLIVEANAKAEYLEFTLDAKKFVGIGNSIWSGSQTSGYKNYMCKRQLNSRDAANIVRTAKKNKEELNLLIKYHEKRSKTTAN